MHLLLRCASNLRSPPRLRASVHCSTAWLSSILPRAMPKKHYYAVRRGRQRGIFNSWQVAQQYVNGFPRAEYRGFSTMEEAEEYLNARVAIHPAAQQPSPPPYSSPPTYQSTQLPAAAAAVPSPFAEVDALIATAMARFQQPPQHSSSVLTYAASRPHQSASSSPPRASAAAAAASSSYPARDAAHPYLRDQARGYRNSALHAQEDEKRPLSAVKLAAAIAKVRALMATDGAALQAPSPQPPSASSVTSISPAPPTASPTSSSSSPSSAPRYAILYCDGAAKANPVGPAGCGGLLFLSDENGALLQCLETYKKYLGTGSNNEAEYRGMIEGMAVAKKFDVTHLTIKMDSELVAKQMCGDYKVKAPNLLPLYTQALTYAAGFRACNIQHIYRSQNEQADQLANDAIAEVTGYTY